MAVASFVAVASGLRLSYGSAGPSGVPAVVMLPGPTDSWRSYEPTLDRLPGYCQGIGLSFRGHGDSDKPASGYSVEDFATETMQFLDALDIDRPVLAAHSGSCMTARRVALDHPDRVAGLVLEASPTTLVGDASLEGFVTSVVAGLEDPIEPDFARSWIGDTSSSDTADRPETDLLVAEVLKVPAHVWKETFRNLLTYDDTSQLPSLAAPTLLLWGDADQLVTEVAQRTLAEAIPNARLSVYSDAGHTPRWDDPQTFANEVATFALDCTS